MGIIDYNMLNLLLNNLPKIFTFKEAEFFLKKRYKAPLKALSAMEKSGEIIRLRRGLYAFSEGFNPLAAACKIYGPSYISFETAMEYYGLIPERVQQIISVVDGRPVSHQTELNRYLYHSQKRQLFSLGMGLIFMEDEPIPMAIPEKALLDTLANHKLETSELTNRDIRNYVIENLRVDDEELKRLSIKKMRDLAPLYRNLAPRKLLESLVSKG